jgi:L-alanine-DL-glutamate epimerase-like enolase superfamily enzyme
MRSAVTGIASVHICATIPNFLALEHHSRNIPLWGQMLDIKEPIQQGYIAVPDGPGLGIELDEEEIRRVLPEGAPLWS